MQLAIEPLHVEEQPLDGGLLNPFSGDVFRDEWFGRHGVLLSLQGDMRARRHIQGVKKFDG